MNAETTSFLDKIASTSPLGGLLHSAVALIRNINQDNPSSAFQICKDLLSSPDVSKQRTGEPFKHSIIGRSLDSDLDTHAKFNFTLQAL